MNAPPAVPPFEIPPGFQEPTLSRYAAATEEILSTGGSTERSGNTILYRAPKGELLAFSCPCDVTPWARRRFVAAHFDEVRPASRGAA